MVLISKEQWKALSPKRFEDLCYDLLCLSYPFLTHHKSYKVEKTRFVQDGGKDITISFVDPIQSYKIWVECKKHQRPINMDVIGKNAVMVILNDVQKLIIMSASHITDNAKLDLRLFAYRTRFKVEFWDGETLENELARHHTLLGKYFPEVKINEEEKVGSEHLFVRCVISEFENQIIEEPNQEKIILRRGDVFYVHVFLKNYFERAIENIRIKFEKTSSIEIYTHYFQERGSFERIEAKEDHVLTFIGEITKEQEGQDGIPFPSIILDYRTPTGEERSLKVCVGNLDASRVERTRLIGEGNHKFLSEDLRQVVDDTQERYNRVIDIRGKSGVGKTRMLEEISHRLQKSGFRTIHFDGKRAKDYTLFRILLSQLIGIRLYDGSVEYNVQELERLLNIRGFHPDYVEKIHKFFVGPIPSDAQYYVSETAKYFMMHESKYAPLGLIIDNVQELNPEVLSIFEEIVTFMQENDGRICLILSTNTEILPIENEGIISAYLRKLDELRFGMKNFITYFECAEFSEEDARLFLLSKFPDSFHGEHLIDLIINKGGKRPLYLEQVFKHMVDLGVVQKKSFNFWYVPNLEKLYDFSKHVSPTISNLIEQRMDILKDTLTQSQLKDVNKLLELLMALYGKAPMNCLHDLGVPVEIVELMISKAFVRYDKYSFSLIFYHDDLFRYFEKRSFSITSTTSKEILSWIGRQDPEMQLEHFPKIAFMCNLRLQKATKIAETGEYALSFYQSLQNHNDVVEIGDTFIQYLETNNYQEIQFERYFRSTWIYAESLLHHVHVQKGLEMYNKLYEGLKYRERKPDNINGFMHSLINANLHNWRYSRAIELLEEFRELNPEDNYYRFIINNRFCVAYTSLGEVKKAEDAIEKALEIAEKMEDKVCLSIGYSDQAYIHLNLTYNVEDLVKNFRKAIKIHDLLEVEPPLFRKIEIPQQNAIVSFLRGAPEEAQRFAEKALWLCRQTNFTFLQIRLFNLKAASLIAQEKYESAETALKYALSLSEIYSNERSRWRIYANLGSLYFIQHNLMMAKEHYEIALEILSKQMDKTSYAKELSFLANLILLYYLNDQKKEIDKIMEKCPEEKLRKYLLMLMSSIRPHEYNKVKCLEPFYLAQHKGVSLLIT